MRSNASLLYFWYAEVELANDHGNRSESSFRAMHILSCLGSGVTYSPFKCQPSNLQLLRARQGFKERIRTVQMAWVRGVIDDQSAALICCAALFEELTSGWALGIEVLDQAFTMVLPGSFPVHLLLSSFVTFVVLVQFYMMIHVFYVVSNCHILFPLPSVPFWKSLTLRTVIIIV